METCIIFFSINWETFIFVNDSIEISGQFPQSMFHRAKFEDHWICNTFDKSNIIKNSLNRLSIAFAKHIYWVGTFQIQKKKNKQTANNNITWRTGFKKQAMGRMARKPRKLFLRTNKFTFILIWVTAAKQRKTPEKIFLHVGALFKLAFLLGNQDSAEGSLL